MHVSHDGIIHYPVLPNAPQPIWFCSGKVVSTNFSMFWSEHHFIYRNTSLTSSSRVAPQETTTTNIKHGGPHHIRIWGTSHLSHGSLIHIIILCWKTCITYHFMCTRLHGPCRDGHTNWRWSHMRNVVHLHLLMVPITKMFQTVFPAGGKPWSTSRGNYLDP